MQRRVSEIVGGGVILAGAIVLYGQTIGTGFVRDEIARDPVWFPRLLLILLALASVGLVVRGFTQAPSGPAERPLWGRFFAVAVLLTAYFLLFETAGYLFASLVFLPALTVLLGYRKPLVIIPVTIIFVVAVWYVFADVFIVRPPGLGVDDIIGWL